MMIKYDATYQVSKKWIQDNTSGLKKIHYCIDENHHITKPSWVICEVCNGEIKK